MSALFRYADAGTVSNAEGRASGGAPERAGGLTVPKDCQARVAGTGTQRGAGCQTALMRADDLTVRQATAGDVALAASPFALYRQLYGRPYDESVAAGFLRARLEHGQSFVPLAELPDGPPVGFAQLYPPVT